MQGVRGRRPKGPDAIFDSLNGAVPQPVSKFSKFTVTSIILKTLNFVERHVPPALLDNLPPFAPAPSPRHGPLLNFPRSPREVYPRLGTLRGEGAMRGTVLAEGWWRVKGRHPAPGLLHGRSCGQNSWWPPGPGTIAFV